MSVAEGYLIEGGRIIAPVGGAVLVGNATELLGGIEMVGNDVQLSDAHWTSAKFEQSVPIGGASPTIKVSSLYVAAGTI
jgi:TldD protein